MALLKKKINNYCFVFDTMNKAIRPKFVAISQTERERERAAIYKQCREYISQNTATVCKLLDKQKKKFTLKKKRKNSSIIRNLAHEIRIQPNLVCRLQNGCMKLDVEKKNRLRDDSADSSSPIIYFTWDNGCLLALPI